MQQILTNRNIRIVLKKWIERILVEDFDGVESPFEDFTADKIISTHSSGATPIPPYITMERNARRESIGRVEKIRPFVDTVENPSNHENGYIVHDEKVFFEIRAVGEAMESALLYLKMSLDRNDIHAFFRAHKISIMNTPVITPSPRLFNSADWIQEESMELELGVLSVMHNPTGYIAKIKKIDYNAYT